MYEFMSAKNSSVKNYEEGFIKIRGASDDDNDGSDEGSGEDDDDDDGQ